MGSPQQRISPSKESRSRPIRNSKTQENQDLPTAFLQNQILLASNHSGRSIASEFFTGDSLVERRRLILFVWQLGAGLGNVGAQLRSMASALRHSPRVCARDACRPTA